MNQQNTKVETDTQSIYDEVRQIDADITNIEAEIVRIEQSLAHDNQHIAENLRERNKRQLERQLSEARKTLKKLNDLRNKALWDIKVIERIGGTPATASELVEQYIVYNGIEILLNNFLTKSDDTTIEATDTIRVRLQLLNAELDLGFRDSIINYAFTEYLSANSIRRREALKLAVQYDGNARAEVWKSLAETCFTEDDPVEYTTAVVRKFIWQVKRKMVGLPVFDHIMPVLYGSQGTGKTQFIKRFVSPIAENISYPNLKEITDSRNRQLWKRWVLIVDEMEGYEKTDVDALKNVITKEVVSGRVLNTHDDFNEINAASLIGASNKTLDELIKDSTGMRRFIQLNWANLDEAGWQVINGVDFLGLWKSVDETGDDPLKPFKDYTKAKQEEFRQKTLVEQWVLDDQRDYGAFPSKIWTDWKRSSLLYVENFLPWYRSRYGNGVYTSKRFGTEMKKLEDRLIKWKKTNGGIKYRLMSNQSADISQDEDEPQYTPDVFSAARALAGIRNRHL